MLLAVSAHTKHHLHDVGACTLPGQGEYAETLSTLRYADNAKKIVNKAVVNEDPNLAMIKQLKDEVKKLKQMLAAAGLLEDGEVPAMPEAQVVEKEVIVYKEDEVCSCYG